jgi:hypothetical protein
MRFNIVSLIIVLLTILDFLESPFRCLQVFHANDVFVENKGVTFLQELSFKDEWIETSVFNLKMNE